MRTATKVAESPHLLIEAVECADDHVRWSAPEAARAMNLVLVRRGRFLLESRGRRTTVDATTGYLHHPDRQMRFSHPAGGDSCTSVTLLGDELTYGLDAARSVTVAVDARLELAHRLLLRTGADPGFAAAEAVLDLLLLAVRGQPGDLPAPGRQDLADRARQAIVADEPDGGGLVALARLLQVSPAHLSRTFRHHVGMPVSRYRNRVRISRALARIDRGDTDLAAIAADLGFSDQAHFTRVMRRELGEPPSSVRALFARRRPSRGDG